MAVRDERGQVHRDGPAVVAVVGRSGSGKTDLVCAAVRHLVERGVRVGTVKHAPKLERVDRQGSDSARHVDAGASKCLLVGAGDAALFWRHEGTGGPDLVEAVGRTFADVEIVLVEGWKGGPFPKIEVYRRAASWREGPLAGELDVLAVITDDPVAVPDGVAVLPAGDIERIVDFLEDVAQGGAPGGST